MNTGEFAQKTGLKLFDASGAAEDIKISGVYCGDLLSWVMGRAQQGSAWLTIMSNVNVAAVCVMADLACVVLCEGVKPDENLASKALSEKINILLSDSPVYETALRISRILPE